MFSFRPLIHSDLDREIVSVSTFYLDKYLSMHYVDEEVREQVQSCMSSAALS